MEINLNNIGKRYAFDWIFRSIDFHFKSKQAYAILGANGSGKSTLLKLIMGYMSPSEGEVSYSDVSEDEIYRHISFSAPYLELIEEYTVLEMAEFHGKFRSWNESITSKDIPSIAMLSDSSNKQIKYLSSGMKQRLKLTIAMNTQAGLVVLDEPTTNLDEVSIEWYQREVSKLTKNSTVLIASNEKRDTYICTEYLNMMNFKNT